MILRKIYNGLNEEQKKGLGVGLVGLIAGLGVGLVGLIGLGVGLVAGLIGLGVGLVAGLGLGLGVGLVGLIGGLVAGLGLGLGVGLGVGLVGGLIGGLIGGLGVGLVGLIGGLIGGEYGLPLWFVILFFALSLIIAEIMFYFAMRGQKRKLSLWIIAERELEELFEVLLIGVNLLNIKWVIEKVDWQSTFPVIVKYTGYVGMVIIGLCIIAWIILLWLHLNRWMVTKR